MNWSDGALKMTIGAGCLAASVFVVDPLVSVIGLWGAIGIVVAPASLFVFFRMGELDAKYLISIHLLAVFGYLALVGASVYYSLIQTRYGWGDVGLMYGFMAVGFIPCIVALRNMVKGNY